MSLRFALIPALVLTGLLGCAGISVESVPENVTGTWKTQSPAPYIIEHSVHKPQGSAVDHDHIELLERTVSVEWTLEERPDGLVVGTNRWVSFGPDGTEVGRATEPLLGVRDRDRLILEEPADEATGTPQLVFDCTFDGPNQIRVIGYEVGSKELMAMRLVLRRE